MVIRYADRRTGTPGAPSLQERQHPVASRVIGYIRCNRDGDDAGARLAAQRAIIEAECARRSWTLVDVISDIAPGRGLDRPGMARALTVLDGQAAEILTAVSLDRVSRTAGDIAALLQRAAERGWTLATVDGAVDPAPERQLAALLAAGAWSAPRPRWFGAAATPAIAGRTGRGRTRGRGGPLGSR